MIKNLLIIATLCLSVSARAQSFSLTYPFAAVTASSGVIDPTPTPTAVGVTSGSFAAVGTPSLNANAAGRFSFVGWPLGSPTGTNSTDVYASMTGSINTTEYYEIILTPQAGFTVALNTMSFTIQRSGTGIRNYAVRASVDGFTNNLPASVATNTNLSVVGANEFFWNFDALSNAQNGSTINFFGATTTSSVALRFYAWNAEAAGGTFSIDNVSIDGSVTGGTVACVPASITGITGNVAICSDETLALASSVTGDAPITYTWTGAGTIAAPNASVTAITGATSGNYTLTVENACGTATSVVTTTVNALPTLSITATTMSICVGNSVTLTGSGAQTYTWDNFVTDGVPFSPVYTNTYTVTGDDANGCSNTMTISISVSNLPAVTLNTSAINLQCVTINSVSLSGGTPVGGVYSGTGVSAGLFSPSTVGVGTYTITYSYTDGNSCTNSATDMITVDACTGIQTLNADVFAMYPNPTKGTLTVKSPLLNTQVTVFDTHGKKVFTQIATSFETQLDVSSLADGLYQVNITSDEHSSNYKLMILK
ncbi:MAG: T9SS type A sorting domain-containing protein [Bacteroidota bacterium]